MYHIFSIQNSITNNLLIGITLYVLSNAASCDILDSKLEIINLL
jgi:hypothetical protein